MLVRLCFSKVATKMSPSAKCSSRILSLLYQEVQSGDFPGGYESACQCRGHRLNPWSWKILHAMGQLSPCSQLLSPHSRACASQLLKPECLELVLCNKRSHYNEKPVYHQRIVPARQTRESHHAAMKTQHSQKGENKLKINKANLIKKKKKEVESGTSLVVQ